MWYPIAQDNPNGYSERRMKRLERENERALNEALKPYCDDCRRQLTIPEDAYKQYDVKRGLRNADGTGVLAGVTRICNVHGYVMEAHERRPAEGRLFYRGIDIRDLIEGCTAEDRFGFEEVVWLLLFGYLPTAEQLSGFTRLLEQHRELPEGFIEDMIIKAPSPNIMNKLARSVLALYSYDELAEDMSLENIVRQSIELIARVSTIMVNAYQVKKRYYDHQSLFFHTPIDGMSFSENILSTMRLDRRFTREEAKLLDICLILHAEHGGGNNSTFACRVLSSSGTDTYAAISAAIGGLKGPRHGGANIKVMQMLEGMKAAVKDSGDDEEIAAYLRKLLAGEAGDRSGLIYGMGHAVYTKSDPRAGILKTHAEKMAVSSGFAEEFRLLSAVERLAPAMLGGKKGGADAVCANVDLYSGLVYKMLGIPDELFTPLFAVARMAGWCAHRIEEVMTCRRIVRPAYKTIQETASYVPLYARKRTDA